MRCRVVCALSEVMLIFWPTSALSSVDLPTLGRDDGDRPRGGRNDRSGCRDPAAGPLGRPMSAGGAAAAMIAAGHRAVARLQHGGHRPASCSAAARAPSPLSQPQRRHRALDLEGLRVASPRVADAVARHRQARLQPFLQFGLRRPWRPTSARAGDDLAEQARTSAFAASSRRREDRADQRLQRVGQGSKGAARRRRAPRLRTAHHARQAERSANAVQAVLAHQVGAHAVRSPSSEPAKRSNSRRNGRGSAPHRRGIPAARCGRRRSCGASAPREQPGRKRWPMRWPGVRRVVGPSGGPRAAAPCRRPRATSSSALVLDEQVDRRHQLDSLS